ncbi:MAG TPA: hypothetical protein VK335_05375 [Bryobacteraceae bacterium]|nr:hypothetical protein [Bryobacteraceae bacterium]
MQGAVRTSSEPGWLQPAVVSRILKPLEWLMRTGESSATMDRLFSSQHVTDLQLVAALSLIAVTAVFFVKALVMVLENLYTLLTLHFWLMAATGVLTSFGPVLAVFAAVLAWAYRAGSARLGVVDLFACEIDTLCRATLVADVARHYVERLDPSSPALPASTSHAPSPHFASQENYFPVFENNTKDLEALEAKVVSNITAFYTYMKAVRDSQRALAEPPEALESVSSNQAAAVARLQAGRNLVYMLFLGLESGRLAIKDLVEFEPEQAERSIVILISELVAYRSLRTHFTDEHDIRYQRLMLRLPRYHDDVPELRRLVEASRKAEVDAGIADPSVSKWEPAWRLLDELKKVYDTAIAPVEPKTQAAGA